MIMGYCRADGNGVCRSIIEPHAQSMAKILIKGDDDNCDAVIQVTLRTINCFVYAPRKECFF